MAVATAPRELQQLVVSALVDASDFVEIGTRICHLVCTELALERCAISLHDASGRPTIAIDRSDATDDERRAWIYDGWATDDPFLSELRVTQAPITGDRELLLPLHEPTGLLGVIRCGPPAVTDDQRRNLVVLASRVSVRLAQLGVRSDRGPERAGLTPRQLEVVQLASRGQTNGEIAAELGLSHNTIKKHLKDVFARLDLTNRTELARWAATPHLPCEVPAGITHLGDITITRG